ncbi:hypothetical protein [Nocardioides sp. AE5]|nr:hypothetical protein [Nocardioides sp. AE5]MDT0200656.1 hypothetical protein [Nocardioides sp. AE5]
MTTFLIILAILAAGFVVYKLRAPILAKILGQPTSRIERRLNQRK